MPLGLSGWDELDDGERERIGQSLADEDAALEFEGVRRCTHPTDSDSESDVARDVAFYRYDDGGLTTRLALIAGGDVHLGLARPLREALRRVMPARVFEKYDSTGTVEGFANDPVAAGAHFTPWRKARLRPLLVEVQDRPFADYAEEDDDVEDVLDRLSGERWRLPTPDEWEFIYRAGTETVFPWGEAWPGTTRCPIKPPRWTNAFGVSFSRNTECTSEYQVLGGGDPSGWSLNGYDGEIVSISAYFMHESHVAHFCWEAYEASGVRRVLRLPVLEAAQ